MRSADRVRFSGVAGFLLSAVLFCTMAAAQGLTFPKDRVLITTPSGGAVTYDVEVANTPQTREVGLMHRLSVPEGTGMLFDFADVHLPERHVTMWMKNTHVSLDMLFIRASGHIARIEASTVPHSLTFIESRDLVRYVLELPAGEAARHGLRAGDCVRVLSAPATCHVAPSSLSVR
jgi:uncharacterized membrane protein (UPF0127 family)